ncbi:MAG: hypothetical protein ABI382_02330 [Nakamurella sp.]
MNIVGDIKNVSEAALGKLAAQFGELPRPLLAAIGAGDVAVERLAKLQERMRRLVDDERDEEQQNKEESDTEGSRISEMAGKAQKVMEDVAHRLGDAAEGVSDRAQQMIADLPAKAQEVANSLSRENLRDTVDSYTKKVADVYNELADRGGHKVHTAEEAAAAEESASPEDSTPEPAGRKTSAKKPSAAAKPAAKKSDAAKASSAKKPGSTKAPADKKPAAKKPAAKKPAAKKPASSDSDSN